MAPSGRGGSRRRWFFVGLVALCALVVYLVIPSRTSSPSIDTVTPTIAARGASVSAQSAPVEHVPAQKPPADLSTEPGESGKPGMDEAQQLYNDFSKFPPWSRPATPAYAELTAFNQRGPEHEQRFDMQDGDEIHARAVLDHMFVAPGRPAQLVVECWRMHGGQRVPVDFTVEAEVNVAAMDDEVPPADRLPGKDRAASSDREVDAKLAFYKGWFDAGEIAMASDRTSAMRKLGIVDLARLPELTSDRPRDARIVAWVQAGGHRKPFELPLRYAAQPAIQILGFHSDAVHDGSLDVTLDVNIVAMAPVRVRAALAPAGRRDAPIAIYDAYYRPEAIGKQVVTLTFFGKILREAAIDGPYEVFALNGSVYRADQMPFPETFWQDDHSYRTRAYHATEFSGDEWQSPERDKMNLAYQHASGR